MHTRPHAWFIVPALTLSVLLGCHRSGEATHETTTASGGAAAALTCSVEGLEGVPQRLPLALPPRCSFSGGGTTGAPRVLTSAEDILAALQCPERDLAALGIDPSTHDVFVLRDMLSPASTGTSVYDDDTTLTYVTRFRPPCPNDPRPMPIQVTVAWLMPKGATRASREASCTLPQRCD
jgi:hypothetical protein